MAKRNGSLRVRRTQLYFNQNGKCFWCKDPMILNAENRFDSKRVTIDHVKPIGEGGTNNPANLVAACLECNDKRNRIQQRAILHNQYKNISSRITSLPQVQKYKILFHP